MPKLHTMRKSKADRDADERRYGAVAPASEDGEHDGVTVHLEHHHLQKMGLDAAKMKHGDPVTFLGEGKVEHAEVESGENGERHSARIRLHEAGMDHEAEHEPEREREELRGDIEAAAKKA